MWCVRSDHRVKLLSPFDQIHSSLMIVLVIMFRNTAEYYLAFLLPLHPQHLSYGES